MGVYRRGYDRMIAWYNGRPSGFAGYNSWKDWYDDLIEGHIAWMKASEVRQRIWFHNTFYPPGTPYYFAQWDRAIADGFTENTDDWVSTFLPLYDQDVEVVIYIGKPGQDPDMDGLSDADWYTKANRNIEPILDAKCSWGVDALPTVLTTDTREYNWILSIKEKIEKYGRKMYCESTPKIGTQSQWAKFDKAITSKTFEQKHIPPQDYIPTASDLWPIYDRVTKQFLPLMNTPNGNMSYQGEIVVIRRAVDLGNEYAALPAEDTRTYSEYEADEGGIVLAQGTSLLMVIDKIMKNSGRSAKSMMPISIDIVNSKSTESDIFHGRPTVGSLPKGITNATFPSVIQPTIIEASGKFSERMHHYSVY